MLKISNYSFVYPNGKKAVDDLNLEILSGDLFAFIGDLFYNIGNRGILYES